MHLQDCRSPAHQTDGLYYTPCSHGLQFQGSGCSMKAMRILPLCRYEWTTAPTESKINSGQGEVGVVTKASQCLRGPRGVRKTEGKVDLRQGPDASGFSGW